MKRKKLSRKASRNNFAANVGSHSKNRVARTMRGGIRL